MTQHVTQAFSTSVITRTASMVMVHSRLSSFYQFSCAHWAQTFLRCYLSFFLFSGNSISTAKFIALLFLRVVNFPFLPRSLYFLWMVLGPQFNSQSPARSAPSSYEYILWRKKVPVFTMCF